MALCARHGKERVGATRKVVITAVQVGKRQNHIRDKDGPFLDRFRTGRQLAHNCPIRIQAKHNTRSKTLPPTIKRNQSQGHKGQAQHGLGTKRALNTAQQSLMFGGYAQRAH